MIEYTNSTIFNVEVQTIVNTINCVGVMGSGLALEYKLRFPEMYKDYAERCSRKEVHVGRPYLYRGYSNMLILNFPTKNHWKYPAQISWIKNGLKYFADNYEKGGIHSVAFPKLGTGRGGLDWHEVKPIMEEYLDQLDIKIYICLDEDNKASGLEGKMVDSINNVSDIEWISILNIGKSTGAEIMKKLPLLRFFQLERITGVGKKSYEKIFRYFYDKAHDFNDISVKPKEKCSSKITL